MNTQEEFDKLYKKRISIETQVNKLLSEKLFSGMKKIIVGQQKERYIKTTEYKNTSSNSKSNTLDKQYKKWFSSISNFYLSYHSIYALHYLVQRELRIRDFVAQEVIRVKADYVYNEIEFSAFYPTHFTSDMTKEIDDCISELKNPQYTHIVDSYILKKDTERSPNPPLTTSELKYSCFYLYGFEPEYVTKLSSILYDSKMITNPQTNGWRIEEQIVEDIITILNQKYPDEKVLQYRRVYTDKIADRGVKECIRPASLIAKYFPKNIKDTLEFQDVYFASKTEMEDALKLYEFIFYTTLATQMKNSIYDTSAVEINVGSRKLREQANVLIEGQENWELLTGQLIQRIQYSETSFKNKVVVLPEIAPETKLKPADIYAYSYQSKRPPRYGVGRFVTQILSKNSIGDINKHDAILKELTESKAIVLIKTMLYPQENAVILIQWLQEHIPNFLNLEYLAELEEKIDSAVNGEISTDSILQEVDRLIESGFESSGFILEDTKPSQAKINLVKSIAAKHNILIEKIVYQSNIQMDLILAKYPSAEPIKIASCPNCNALVYQKEFIDKNNGEVIYYFSCEEFNKNSGCSFSLWDSYIHKFFSKKGLELFTIEERASTLKKILSKKKGYLFNDFIAKNGKPYDAKVFTEIQADETSKQIKWGFSLEFANKRK